MEGRLPAGLCLLHTYFTYFAIPLHAATSWENCITLFAAHTVTWLNKLLAAMRNLARPNISLVFYIQNFYLSEIKSHFLSSSCKLSGTIKLLWSLSTNAHIPVKSLDIKLF